METTPDFKVHVVGHNWAIELFKQQEQVGRVAQSLLLTGPPNIGKSTLARFWAQYLNCVAEQRPCGHCSSCRKMMSGNHPDIRIFDENEPLKIDQIRELQRELSLSPVEGRYRVALLCNFERATTGAANALLKTLEEPASQVVLILTAVEPGSLLPTIVSRCQMLKLRPLANEPVLTALQSRWQTELAQAELLTQLSAGRLGWAVNALTDQEFLARRTRFLEDMLDLLRMHRAERLVYASELSRDTAALKEALVLWLILWRDLLLLLSGGQTKVINLDWQDQLQPIARRSNLAQAKEMVGRLQKAYQNLDRNVNPRLNLEVVLLHLPRYADI
ncbi:MAG TPA: DNA polymerase III subunit delta' [Anaerolineae bacterium]|nr:DNA polymerase III subunit delta' [Anaerolineae bacterium]HRV95749.1 DNA polymerase III subunit delta' [Anaerolineae bacterium]